MSDLRSGIEDSSSPPRHSAGVLHPPFVVLAAGAPVAAAIGWFLGSLLHGQIDLAPLGYLVASGGYALFAALLLFMDAGAARRLPERRWASRDAMWRSVWRSTFLALLGAVGFGFVVLGALGMMAQLEIASVGTFLVPAALLAALLWSIVRNVRARRRTAIAPP